MPRVYLSPSTQEFNKFVNGGNEEFYANLITDVVVKYLRSSGISYSRNTPEMTAGSSLRQANQEIYDLYVAIHSNAAPDSLSGRLRGTDVYYFPTSANGQRMANITAENFKEISQTPDKVQARPTTRLGEVSKTKAPAVLIEVAYHDNIEDANWIKNNIELIGKTIAMSITEYFGLPLVSPQEPRKGRVSVSSGRLNIRAKPSTSAPILTTAVNNTPVTVLGKWEDWYVVNVGGIIGYAASQYITI